MNWSDILCWIASLPTLFVFTVFIRRFDGDCNWEECDYGVCFLWHTIRQRCRKRLRSTGEERRPVSLMISSGPPNISMTQPTILTQATMLSWFLMKTFLHWRSKKISVWTSEKSSNLQPVLYGTSKNIYISSRLLNCCCLRACLKKIMYI